MLLDAENLLARYQRLAGVALAAIAGLLTWQHEASEDRSRALRDQVLRLQVEAYEQRRSAADSLRTSLALLEGDILRLNDTLRTLSLERRLGYSPREWNKNRLLPLVARVDTTSGVVRASFARYASVLDLEPRRAAYARWWWLRNIAWDLRLDNTTGVYAEQRRTEQLALLDSPSFRVRAVDSLALTPP